MRRTPVEWRPCPRCETELDPDSGHCPVCLWDPAVSEVVVPAEPQVPYLEKYRGTQYAGASATPQRPLIALSRTRVLVTLGVMAVALLYGALVMVADMRAGADRPAVPLVLLLAR